MAIRERWYFTKQELDNSPSKKCGITCEKELSYRQQAANLIQDMGQKLKVNQLVINTAIVYMHRFYTVHSFAKFHRNAISSCALFLAAKVEEQHRKLEHVIKVSQMCINREINLDTKSEHYQSLATELVYHENVMLRTLGFDLSVPHPHTSVVKVCQLVRAHKDLAQASYIMATNSLHLTTMCLQYKPTVVACICIYLVCKWAGYELARSIEGKDWWTYVDEHVTQETLEELTAEFIKILEKCPSRLKKILNPNHMNNIPNSPSLKQFEDKKPSSLSHNQSMNNNESTVSQKIVVDDLDRVSSPSLPSSLQQSTNPSLQKDTSKLLQTNHNKDSRYHNSLSATNKTMTNSAINTTTATVSDSHQAVKKDFNKCELNHQHMFNKQKPTVGTSNANLPANSTNMLNKEGTNKLNQLPSSNRNSFSNKNNLFDDTKSKFNKPEQNNSSIGFNNNSDFGANLTNNNKSVNLSVISTSNNSSSTLNNNFNNSGNSSAPFRTDTLIDSMNLMFSDSSSEHSSSVQNIKKDLNNDFKMEFSENEDSNPSDPYNIGFMNSSLMMNDSNDSNSTNTMRSMHSSTNANDFSINQRYSSNNNNIGSKNSAWSGLNDFLAIQPSNQVSIDLKNENSNESFSNKLQPSFKKTGQKSQALSVPSKPIGAGLVENDFGSTTMVMNNNSSSIPIANFVPSTSKLTQPPPLQPSSLLMGSSNTTVDKSLDESSTMISPFDQLIQSTSSNNSNDIQQHRHHKDKHKHHHKPKHHKRHKEKHHKHKHKNKDKDKDKEKRDKYKVEVADSRTLIASTDQPAVEKPAIKLKIRKNSISNEEIPVTPNTPGAPIKLKISFGGNANSSGGGAAGSNNKKRKTE